MTGKSKERLLEGVATFGLLLVAVSMVAPFAGVPATGWMEAFKWIYAAGAVVYTVARIAGGAGKKESFRVRRLRRMEGWAGIAFCIGAGFWFYNSSRFGGVFTFRLLNNTILFTLVGALIQIVSSWLLSKALRKEGASDASDKR